MHFHYNDYIICCGSSTFRQYQCLQITEKKLDLCKTAILRKADNGNIGPPGHLVFTGDFRFLDFGDSLKIQVSSI